ncbi:MAG TPA: S1/P1 nuclease [Thermoanaerobaculia bacterium]|jgi:hypothetical protein
MIRRFSVALLLATLAAPAFGWGEPGHKIVATLAQKQLRPATRQRALAMLNGMSFALVAKTPDDFRTVNGARTTDRWHFVDAIVTNEDVDLAADCRFSDCVVAQIDKMKAIVANEDEKPEVRREALIYLIHFVGDIHQPFHASFRMQDGKEDRGANSVKLKFRNRDTSLHGFWDTGLIGTRALSTNDYVEHLEDDVLPDLADGSNGGTPEEWANESHDITRENGVYLHNGDTVSESYVTTNLPKADRQLALAGIRLAKLIEDALGPN